MYLREVIAKNIRNPTQLHVLKRIIEKKRKIPEVITAEYVLYEIAELEGHIKNNGFPGRLVLRRGFEKLFLMEQGWNLAQAATQ